MQIKDLIVAGAVVSTLVALPQPVQAHHRPSRYCSASGDICQSSRKHDGVRRLRIGSAARYFRVFHICVLDPRGYRFLRPLPLAGAGRWDLLSQRAVAQALRGRGEGCLHGELVGRRFTDGAEAGVPLGLMQRPHCLAIQDSPGPTATSDGYG